MVERKKNKFHRERIVLYGCIHRNAFKLLHVVLHCYENGRNLDFWPMKPLSSQKLNVIEDFLPQICN